MEQSGNPFSPEERAVVNQAVQSAESRTAAELVPVIAAESGRYDRSEDVAGLWMGLLWFLIVRSILPGQPQAGSWSGPSPVVQSMLCCAAIVLGFLVGAFICSRLQALRRLFTPTVQMRHEVRRAAGAVFFDQRVHHTRSASGVLLYVSLFERMAVILTDQAVLNLVGQARIDAWCADLTQRLRQETPIVAMSAAIEVIGNDLASVLPVTDSDVNELPDALVYLR